MMMLLLLLLLLLWLLYNKYHIKQVCVRWTASTNSFIIWSVECSTFTRAKALPINTALPICKTYRTMPLSLSLTHSLPLIHCKYVWVVRRAIHTFQSKINGTSLIVERNIIYIPEYEICHRHAYWHIALMATADAAAADAADWLACFIQINICTASMITVGRSTQNQHNKCG